MVWWRILKHDCESVPGFQPFRAVLCISIVSNSLIYHVIRFFHLIWHDYIFQYPKKNAYELHRRCIFYFKIIKNLFLKILMVWLILIFSLFLIISWMILSNTSLSQVHFLIEIYSFFLFRKKKTNTVVNWRVKYYIII